MKVLLQRVQHASLKAFSEKSSSYESAIEYGLLAYVSVGQEDQNLNTEKLTAFVQKICKGRFFSKDFMKRIGKSDFIPAGYDSQGRSHHLSLSLIDIKGSLLVVSQITLQGALKKGTQPAFDKSAAPALAQDVYEQFSAISRQILGKEAVKTGLFGAHMELEVKLDGPVTFLLEV